MSFVIYHKESTLYLKTWMARAKLPYHHIKDHYATRAAAKAAITRICMLGGFNEATVRENFAIEEAGLFHASIEKKETRRGIAACEGQQFEVGVNTSWTSGPWSETYWAT